MRDFVPYLKLIRGELRRSLLLSFLLACVAALASVGLTGLAGWFITISAIVGVLGITTFSFVFPARKEISCSCKSTDFQRMLATSWSRAPVKNASRIAPRQSRPAPG